MRRGLMLAALCLLPLAAPAQEVRDASTFATWRAANAPVVLAFETELAKSGLSDVIELGQLLRSASAWQECRAAAYAVAPPEQWPAVISVLRLLKELSGRGLLGQGGFQVHSGYRDAALNECAGGAPRSAHLKSFAIDLTPLGNEDLTQKLCGFWHEEGRAWNMGLSRYPSGRIHIDTAGYRTWGADLSGKSTACSAAARSAGQDSAPVPPVTPAPLAPP